MFWFKECGASNGPSIRALSCVLIRKERRRQVGENYMGIRMEGRLTLQEFGAKFPIGLLRTPCLDDARRAAKRGRIYEKGRIYFPNKPLNLFSSLS